MTEKAPPADRKPDVFTLSDFNSRTQLTEKDLENDYNPADNRPQELANSTAGSLAHLLKSSLGTGILAMPMAFKNSGLLFGAVGTLVVGFLCTHCVWILVRTSQDLCKQIKVPALSFAETAGKAFENGPQKVRRFANIAEQFVDIALMATYFSAACVYVVFISESFHDVINYDCDLDWDIRIYIAMAMAPLLIMGQIRRLKLLVPFSALANLFIVITFAITLYFMFNEKLDFSDKPLFASVSTLPLFFSTVIFAMEGIGVVMPVENTMKKPQHFLGCPGVLNAAMITVISLYALIGFFGYIKFGEGVKGSITLNLEEGDPVADVAKLLMGLAILFTYGLQFYVPMDILWRKIKHRISKEKHNMSQILIRSGIVLCTGAIAAAVPKLEPFIGLVGAVFFSVLGLLVPTVVETIYRWPDRLGKFNWMLWKNIVLGIFAIFALVTGAAVSIEEIIKIYK